MQRFCFLHQGERPNKLNACSSDNVTYYNMPISTLYGSINFIFVDCTLLVPFCETFIGVCSLLSKTTQGWLCIIIIVCSPYGDSKGDVQGEILPVLQQFTVAMFSFQNGS